MRAAGFMLVGALLPCHWALADPVQFIKDGKSDFCIRRSVVAPSSVVAAARDLQRYVQRATDAYLPIVFREEGRCQHYIHLGESSLAADLPFEAYRIVTRNGDIHITGKDTKDGKLTPTGGTSHGTSNGVYTFLEDYLGVRWLMPGEVGEDIPRSKDVRIPDLDRIDTPGFDNRLIPYIQNENPLAQQWLRRQKQGYSLQINHYHNFRHLLPAEEYEQHPEWFAQLDGKRPRPGDRYKLETTNPDLIRFVASRIREDLRRMPSLYSYSISPSDSGGWSTSPESHVFYDHDPHGKVSVTPLVLDFYRNVAAEVGKEYPDRILCGYVYTSYLYPPSQGIPELPDNLCLVLAASISYGYGLHRDSTRRDFEELLRTWPKATHNISYFDLPVNLLQSFGAPNPPGLEILAYLYPRLADAGMRGMYMFGINAWGQGALTNYLLAKLNWNPRANVSELAREFFLRAYGNKAGPIMQELYEHVDDANKKFHQQDAHAGFRLTPLLLQKVYKPLLPDMERLFNNAQHAAATPQQRQRLWMFQVNMNRFMHYLEDAGIADFERESIFSDSAMNEFRPERALSGLEMALASKPDAEDVPAYKLRLRQLRDKVLSVLNR